MKRTSFLVLLAVLCPATLWAADNGPSIGLNFGADEPNGGLEAIVNGPAGVAGSRNWNNLELAASFGDDIIMDVNGTAAGTGVSVEWISNNTWSSDGRGEDTNDAVGSDRALMLGYLDTTDTSITEVIIDGIPDELSSGFDVLLYVQGGVIGRGGTYTVVDSDGNESMQNNISSTIFDGTYIRGEEGNYLVFEGLTGSELTIYAQATDTTLFRGPLNAVEICAVGACLPKPTPVAGRGSIGNQTVGGAALQNEVLGPPGEVTPGLAQEWYAVGNPGNKDALDAAFAANQPIVPAFQAGHGTTWWSGSDAPFADLVQYPEEVQPTFNDTNNDNYSVRATGEILIPESGTYRFTDGVDDFTYLAIDSDKSGVAGDSPEEVLINDNAWTNVFRTGNNGGQGLGEVDFDVAAGGEWLAIEFNMGEGGGGDSGVIYWDYSTEDGVGGGVGFPEIPEDPIDAIDAEFLYIPDTHLRSAISPLISADLVASIPASELGWEFEINATDGTADAFTIENPNPDTYTTVLNVDGQTFHLNVTGDPSQGDSFQIIDVDRIVGTPTIATAGWTFNAGTGFISFGAGLVGDFDGNGAVEVADLDVMVLGNAAYDVNSDGNADAEDLRVMVQDIIGTWYGDSNGDGEFSSGDFVQVFTAGKFETNQPATWSEGDWNLDGIFSSADFVAAFTDGGFELGPKGGVSAVPEPATGVMALLCLPLLGLFRRRVR